MTNPPGRPPVGKVHEFEVFTEKGHGRHKAPGRPAIGRVVEVRLPPDLDDATKRRAKADNVSAAEIHRRALAEYLKEKV